MYKLCWIKKSWDRFDGLKHFTEFESLEKLFSVMEKCVYNGEWVEDSNGNKLNIDLREICF